MMIYNKHVTSTKNAKTGTGRRAEEKPDCNPIAGRRAGCTATHCGSRESIRSLFCSGGHQADYRKEIEEINRMERDRKLLAQQPAPDPAFLQGGTHG